MPHFSVDNGTVNYHYKIYGHGPIRALFINGLATPMGDWKRQVEFFSKNPEQFQIVLVDNRGVGQTSSPVGLYSASRMALDALEFLDDCLHWERFHLVGLSMGGMIALELALLTMHRLLSLTLMVTHAGGITSVMPMAALVRSLKYRPNHTPEEYVDNILPLLYSKEWRKQLYVDEDGVQTNETNEEMARREMVALREKNPAKFMGLVGQLGAVFTHYVSSARLEELKNSKVPVLIMTGTKDKLVRPINSFLLKDILEPEEFIVFEGAGHMIHKERYLEVNAALCRHFCLHNNRLSNKPKL
eukprot:TRINITY_DN14514_c0_g1_i1.p1 TRINITY_DN14514_c0_g1~~TRINITY_DN14514_c0_g1_i1.p1  ORF type:complete len:301 (+),score=41.01 TRINITY_DN14514_c0_g1_i1:185-1087(+)